MANSSRSIRDELTGVLVFVAILWLLFLVSVPFPSLKTWGIQPRTMTGLIGIGLAPFLHVSIQHLLGNTVPLLVLLTLLAGSRAKSWQIVAIITVLAGFLLWLFGRTAIHIGASGLIFGLITFLIVSGILERRVGPLLVTFLVAFLYGGTLLVGVIPWNRAQMSWDGHLSGAVAGATVAYLLVGSAKRETTRVVGEKDARE